MKKINKVIKIQLFNDRMDRLIRRTNALFNGLLFVGIMSFFIFGLLYFHMKTDNKNTIILANSIIENNNNDIKIAKTTAQYKEDVNKKISNINEEQIVLRNALDIHFIYHYTKDHNKTYTLIEKKKDDSACIVNKIFNNTTKIYNINYECLP
jgi:hypothetical protein